MKIGDLIIGLVAIIIMAILGIGYKLYMNSLGDDRYVSIYVDGEVRDSIKLTNSNDEIYTVLTDKGKFIEIVKGKFIDTEYDYNVIHIHDGGVEVIEADCDNQDDVRQPFVKMPGIAIICVPHHLKVIIEGGDPANDAIAQ